MPGYDDTPGSTRAKLCWKGNQMFPALDEDLHFGYQLTGSLVVASSAEDEAFLEELYQRGLTNGVQNLRIVRGAELRQISLYLPYISPTSPLHLPRSRSSPRTRPPPCASCRAPRRARAAPLQPRPAGAPPRTLQAARGCATACCPSRGPPTAACGCS